MTRRKLLRKIERIVSDPLMARSLKLIQISGLMKDNFAMKDKDFGKYCYWPGETIPIAESRKRRENKSLS